MDISPSTSQSRLASSSQISNELGLKFQFMQLLDEVNSLAGQSNIRESIQNISHVVDKADQLFSKVEDTTDMGLDARVMASSTSNLDQATNSVDVGEGNFTLRTFAEQFRTKALDNAGRPSWEALAAVAEPAVHNSLPKWSPLLGSFDYSAEFTPSQKQPRQRRQKDQIAEKKEPEKLSQVEKTQEGVEVIVQRIFSKLKKHYRANKHQPLSYFKFVVNPTSFGDTVENIFHVSFLVNDGHVKLDLDSNGMPIISPTTSGQENNSQNTSGSKDRKQIIMSIDMETWQELITALDIREAMI